MNNYQGEVNMTAFKTICDWKPTLYLKFDQSETNTIKSGSVIRIFLKEYEKYMMVDEKDGKIYFCSIQDLPKFGGSTLWEIQADNTTKGVEIYSNQSYRLKNLATSMYLTTKIMNIENLITPQQTEIQETLDIQDSEKSSVRKRFLEKKKLMTFKSTKVIEKRFVLFVSKDSKDFWELISSQKKTGKIVFDSFLKIRNQNTSWLHVHSDLSCETNTKMFEEDVFGVPKVDEKEIEDLKFFQVIQRRLKEDTTNCLKKLLDYDDKVKRFQKQYSLKVITDIIINYISKVDLNREDKANLKLISLGYNFLSKYAYFNDENGSYIFKFFESFHKHMPIDVGATEMIHSIFLNNQITTREIKESEIDYFFNYLIKIYDKKFISILSVLCVCKGIGMTKNQNIIIDRLIKYNILFIPEIIDEKIQIRVGDNLFDLESIKKKNKMMDIFIEMIYLLSFLSKGRNNFTITFISKYYSRKTIELFLKEKDLSKLKSTFIYLYINLYVDVEPYQKKPLISYTREWEQIEIQRPKYDHFDEIKKLIPVLLIESQSDDLQNAVCEIIKNLFAFGIIYEDKEYHPLLIKLVEILSKSSNDPLFYKLIGNVCDVIHQILDLMIDQKITKSVISFKEKGSFPKFNLKPFEKLSEFFLKLMKYNNEKLQVKVSLLLSRYFTFEEQAKKDLQNVKVLNPHLVKQYQLMDTVVTKLRKSLSSNMIFASIEEERYFKKTFKDIIFQFIVHLRNDSSSKIIINSLGFIELVISGIQANYPSEIREFILESLFNLLQDFVRDNPENQLSMKKYLNYFINLISEFKNDFITPFLIECVKNNKTLCYSIDQRMIQNILSNIGRGLPGKVYLEFLSEIVSPQNEVINSNQILIIDEIFQRKKDTILLFNDEDGMKLRNELIEQEEFTESKGKLNYHMALLDLLTKCAYGRVYFSEVRIQSLFMVDDLMLQINDPLTQKVPNLKSKLLLFLNEVYLNIAKPIPKFTHTDGLSTLFDLLLEDLNSFIDGTLDDSFYIFDVIIEMMTNYFTTYKEYIGSNADVLSLWTEKLLKLYSKIVHPFQFKKVLKCLEAIKNVPGSLASKDESFSELIEKGKLKKVTLFREKNTIDLQNQRDFNEYISKELEKEKKNVQNFSNIMTETINKNIIDFLRSLTKNNEETIKIILFYLNSMIELIKGSNNIEETQNMLVKCGACELLTDLIITTPSLNETMIFGYLLMEGGNKNVQNKFYEIFEKDRSGLFFTAMKGILRKGKSIIKELKSKNKLKQFKADEKTIDLLKNTLKFLQFICEGHNLNLQQILNAQKNANESINLVNEVLEFTLFITKYIDRNNIHVATQCFDSLTEFIQGPCIENILFLNSKTFYLLANNILNNDFISIDGKFILDYKDQLILKEKVMTTLLSLISETRNLEINKLMMKSFKPETLKEKILSIHENRKYPQNQISFEHLNYPPDEIIEIIKLEIGLGFKYFHLLKYFGESNPEIKNSLRSNEYSFFNKETGSIEVIRNGKFDRIFFRIPEKCNNLTKETKENFVYYCNRETPQIKIEDLFNNASKFKTEMDYYSEHSKILNRIKYYWPYVQSLGLILATLIVLLITLTYGRVFDVTQSIPIPGITDTLPSPTTGSFLDPYSETIYLLLNFSHFTLTAILLIANVIYQSPLQVRIRFNLSLKEKWNDIPFDFKFIIKYFAFIFMDGYLWFLLFSFLLTVLALILSPLIWCLLLFGIVYTSQTLRFIIRSVTDKLSVLGTTLAMFVSATYSFISLYFVVFNDQMQLKDSRIIMPYVNDNNLFCGTLFQCFLHIYDYGVRTRFVLENMCPAHSAIDRFVVDMLFKIIIIILLLSICFGIIIESYAKLRSESLDLENELKVKCFICDIHKNRFDPKASEGITYQNHIQYEHGIWDYIAFLIYISEKESTEYTGIEQYINEMIMKKDLTFFPLLRSMSLEESEQKK